MISAGTMFENWCSLQDVKPIPAAPALVAKFVVECAPLGIEKVWPSICEISLAHCAIGLADPTAGGPVSAAINVLAAIDPPRSWPKEKKARFLSLPYDLQVYVAAHEEQREKEIRRAHNEAAKARQAIQQPAKATNGIQSQPAA